MVEHMKKHNLFSDKQFGFISERSSVLQLLAVIESWTKVLDEGKSIDVVYCNHMKAFWQGVQPQVTSQAENI